MAKQPTPRLPFFVKTAFFAIVFSFFSWNLAFGQCNPDVQSPIVTCSGGVSVNFLSNNPTWLWATDFLQNASDNCTPSQDLQFSLVRTDQNFTNFPLDGNGQPFAGANFYCSDIYLACLDYNFIMNDMTINISIRL